MGLLWANRGALAGSLHGPEKTKCLPQRPSPLFAQFPWNDWITRYRSSGRYVKGYLVLRIRLPYFTNGKLRLIGNALAVSTVTAIGIPRALFMLVGGVLTDHFTPRNC
jgi:hypothetical protein